MKILETVKNFIKKNKKLVTVVSAMFCAVVLVAGSIAGTIAYLTSQSETVTNTFTVGKITITLDETDVDLYGVKDSETRVKANKYKLIPGHTYVKDPTIHVAADSETCYLFVVIENGLDAIDGTSISGQMATNGWTQLSGNIYYYNKNDTPIVPTSNAVQDIKVFESFTLDGGAAVADYSAESITVTAYAVQSDGFNSAKAAWNATFGVSSPIA